MVTGGNEPVVQAGEGGPSGCWAPLAAVVGPTG
jgi:hypothetical protein